MESTDPASMEHSPAENSDIAFSSLDAATALASMRSRPGIGVAPDTVAAPFSPLGASYLDMNTSFDYGMLENEPLLEYTPEQYVDQQMPQQTPQTSMDGIEFNLNMMDFIPPTAVTDPGPGFIQADMFTPPEINIEYAPNSRQMYFEPPGIVKGGTLSAPSVSQTRNRLRVRSDPYSSKFTQLQDRERAQSEPPEPKPTPPKGATRESLESYIGRSWPAHSPDKPYICPVCDEAFQLRITRERHEITNHGKDKNGKYACSGFLDGNNWGCGVRFTRTDLRKHFRSEAGRNCRRPLREKVAKSNDEVYKEVEQYEKHKEGEKRNIDKEEEEQESLEEETNANPPSSRKRRKITRRKIRPSQKDFVLIRVMDPKRPDIARLVGERGLNSESGSDVDSDMEDDPVTAETTSPETTNLNLPSLDLQKLAQRVFDAKSPLPSLHRDSIAKPENLPKASTPASKVDEGHNIPDTTMENTDNMFVYDPATNIGRVSKPLEPVRQFNCDLPGCTYSIMGERFTVVNELQQHKERVHNLSTEHTLYRCTNKSCKERLKVWSNLDDLWQHVILMHPDNGDIALIDKPVISPMSRGTEPTSPKAKTNGQKLQEIISNITQNAIPTNNQASESATLQPSTDGPPDSWTPPFTKDTESFHFKTRQQELNDIKGCTDTHADLNYLDQLWKFHRQHGNTLTHLPSIENGHLDLYKLKKAVEARGGFDRVCEQKKWAKIGRDLGYSGKIMSSHSMLLKNSYQIWLHPFEEYLLGNKPSVDQMLEFAQPRPFTPSPDSGYHSGLGTDTESACSLDSVGSSLGLPQNFLHEFIAFFGDTLIEKAGARQWAEYALAHRSSEEIEKQLNELLKEYAIELASKPPTFWVSDCLKQTHQVQDFAQSQVLTGAINLIRRYRPKIAQYFRSNAVSLPVGTASLSERLQELGQQLSLTERLGLFTKSSSNTKNPDLQTDDDIKDDGEEGELVANLGPVRDLLVSSDAFRRLALDLRRTLYHDEGVEMEKIRCALLEGKQHPLHNAKFNVNWALSEFMHTQYGRELPSIGSVVVLTGSALYAQATTCAEYIKSTWPKTGHILIELLDTALKVPNTAPIHINKDCEGLPLIVNIRSGPTGDLIFYARGSDELLMVELVQQIAFIGSALSTSPFGDELAYATPSVRRTSYPSMFDISFEHKRLHATETACWLPLFRGAVIASGFPIPNRADEMGLEIPLELLAGIAGVRHAVEYEGGIVMKGFSHMFIPVRKLDDRVQWHAISSQDPETRLSYQDALARCKARALSKEVSLEHIQSCRAIVGWCSVATSRLGSDLANYENIDYSGAKDVDSAIRCAGGSLGFQQFGMAALDFKFGAKDGKCHFQRSGPYQRIVSAAEKTPIVLYDTGEQRAWLVPASSVMLHMAQHRHTLEPFEMNEKRVRLNTNVPLDSSAKKVLLNNESLRLSDTEEYTFKDVILNIWSLLEFLIDQNVTRDRNASGACLKGTLHDSLTGFEFKAVVEERSPFRQKQMHLGKTNGGWPQLVRDIDALVLLADGFEDIILPADQGNPRLCRSWQRVPKGQDHLATSTKTLKELYDVAGCRLSRKYLTSTQLQWHQGDSILFDACKGFAKTCQCSRLQQIFPKSAVGAIIPPKIILDQGAVIFGQTGSMLQDLRSKLHTQTPKSSSIYSQPNIPLTPIVIKHDPEDPSFSDGDIWGQSGSDATAESTPGSLSTCTTLSTQDAPSEINELSMNMYLSTGSRKRLHLPESCSGLSNEDDKEQKESPDFACKRPKSSHVDGIPLPPLSTSPKYNDDEKDALGRRYSRSDSLLPGSNWTIFPTDKRYDYALPSTTAAETQDYVEDGENTGSLPLTVRLVDEKPLRTLRRRDGFH